MKSENSDPASEKQEKEKPKEFLLEFKYEKDQKKISKLKKEHPSLKRKLGTQEKEQVDKLGPDIAKKPKCTQLS